MFRRINIYISNNILYNMKSQNKRTPWNKGKKIGSHTEEWNNKISESHKGKSSGMLGKHFSEEAKLKISISMKENENSKGVKPWNYIDGRSKLLAPARYGDDWDKIRYLVYLRDRFTCQDCGITGQRLDIHHIIPFLKSHDNSLLNLVTLCRSCHMKREKLNYKEVNNLWQQL